MQRVMIIRGPGSGKSWLAHQIGVRQGLPVISIDDLLHDRDGHLRPAHEIDQAAGDAAKADRWVIEGGNSRTYAERAARADLVIRMTTPKWLRLLRVLVRGDASFNLVRWVLLYDRTFELRDKAAMQAASEHAHVLELGSARRVGEFLNGLSCPSGRGASPIGKGESVV
jgi:adenylate kinase family enzyme